MAIRVKCPECQKIVKGGDDWAGRSGKCPNCGRILQFPPADPPTERQLNYAKKLGINVTTDMSKADVSAAIAQVELENPSLARQRQHVNESRYKKTHGPELVEAEKKWQKLADANKWMIAVYQGGKSMKVSVIRLNEASITDKSKLVIHGELAEVEHNRKYDFSLIDLDKTIDLPFEKIKWYEIIDELDVDDIDGLNAAMNRGKEAANRLSGSRELSPGLTPATAAPKVEEVKIDTSVKPRTAQEKSTG